MDVNGVRRVMDSYYERTVRTMGGDGDRGVNLPADWREEHGIEKGDSVVLERTDDGALKVLPPE